MTEPSDATNLVDRYGEWAIVAGGSDGVGLALADELARRGMNLVLVARRPDVLEQAAADLVARHGIQARSVPLDLAAPDAIDRLRSAVSGLDVGVYVANAGSDGPSATFLDKDLDTHLALVQRNCVTVLAAAHSFGADLVAQGRGAFLIVTSGAAWAGGRYLSVYGASKAFDLVLAEGLWAEWREHGVDVLALVLGRTDTPSLHRALAGHGGAQGPMADPADVAREALDHLGDGPTWSFGAADPQAGSPLAALPRRQAVALMSGGIGGSES